WNAQRSGRADLRRPGDHREGVIEVQADPEGLSRVISERQPQHVLGEERVFEGERAGRAEFEPTLLKEDVAGDGANPLAHRAESILVHLGDVARVLLSALRQGLAAEEKKTEQRPN